MNLNENVETHLLNQIGGLCPTDSMHARHFWPTAPSLPSFLQQNQHTYGSVTSPAR